MEMPIIAISSDSPQQETLAARGVADSLGYALVGREILGQIAAEHGVSEKDLLRALDEPPGFFAMRARQRQALLTHVRAACLERLSADNVVCVGLGAHAYLAGVSHALRVRLLAGPGDGQGQDKPDRRQQERRRRLSLEAFGLDDTDPDNYDMVLSLASLEPAQAVAIIAEAAGYPKFQAMTYSRKCLADKALAAKVRQRLLAKFPEAKVDVSDGGVVVRVAAIGRGQRKKQLAVRELASQAPGVNYVEVHVINDFFGSAAQSGR
ncbi:conserved hypothetical protein [Desulfarculus baarsii DSM 2075]|uniref:Cytidylate kinase-like family protein n=1 Tax=Desulfarculus baarsii (strain ATCC 33931 / DSM 2075 / LMG 7858 / VKM B-1802 / 2st14) TaxID=644282 RepID=E1QDQ6_DESB2|nr:cytidylate kinase family protein [Desulfarculus baarsii]ADK83692.1 conserved hypothetical protein [Desulfarculus baarsii DSM 2075]